MDAWYSVMAMGFGYLAAFMILLVVILTGKKMMGDQRLFRKVKKERPQIGLAGEFQIVSGGSKKLSAGRRLEIPYEGTIGSAPGCDVVLSGRRIRARSAFFWAESGKLHLVPLQKDKFQADGEPIGPGDEAVMTTGAILSVGALQLELQMYEKYGSDEESTSPYVTQARRVKAHQGKGKGIGGNGRVKTKRRRFDEET